MVLYLSMCMCVCIYSHYEMIQFSSVGQSFLTLCDPHGLLHARPPCPSPIPRVYSNSCPLSRWCHPTISSSVIPFSSHLQSFPASGSFPMSWFMAYPILFFMASNFTSITSHIHNWLLFLLWLCLFIISEVISPGAYWAPSILRSSYFSHTFLPFHTVHGVLKARILKWFTIPFSSGPRLVTTLDRDLSVLGNHGIGS